MTGGDMRAAMAAMHGLCRRRRRELTVIGISTPTATPLTPAEVRQAGWGPRGPTDPPRRPRARPRAARSKSTRQPPESRSSRPSTTTGAVTSSRPKRSSSSPTRRTRSRTGRSTSPSRSPAWAAAASCSRCAGVRPPSTRRRSCGQGELSRPKSGRACTVPMVEQVDKALTKLAGRERHTQPADLVFPARRAATWTRWRRAAATWRR